MRLRSDSELIFFEIFDEGFVQNSRLMGGFKSFAEQSGPAASSAVSFTLIFEVMVECLGVMLRSDLAQAEVASLQGELVMTTCGTSSWDKGDGDDGRITEKESFSLTCLWSEDSGVRVSDRAERDRVGLKGRRLPDASKCSSKWSSKRSSKRWSSRWSSK
mmetsp:Transcript_9901/g.14695  ORF Transcript_9901/g.14695 Transcript_9901/m.14695 type:complete len:160 (-) Transcript_9901:994-1473(-)